MDFMTAVKTCFSKYSDFSGRARRSEYWWFYLFLFVANIAAGVVDAVLGTQIVSGAFALATVLPVLAAGARRLHDTDRSGWWQLLPLGPLLVTIGASFMMEDSLVTGIAAVASLLGAVLLIVWLASDSQPGPNRFGPSPK